MKILHTSDWHLGAMDGTRSLFEDQRFFLDRIGEIVRENGVDAVLIAGDIYDRSVASAEAVRLYDRAMTKLCLETGVAVLSIAGNHDSAERLSSCGELLSKEGLYICGSLEREPFTVEFPDTEISLLPWITEEKVKSVFPEKKEAIRSLEDAYQIVTDNIRAGLDPNKKHIIVSHAFITDSETSTSDRAAEIGFATQVSAKVFDGFDYVALGHIHKPQNVTDTVRYSGTPMPYSFGKEETQEKSVTLIDTEDMSQTILPLPLLHSRRTFTGTLEEILHPSCSDAERNGFVRLCVTDEYLGLETLSRLREIYPNLLEAFGKSFEGEETTVTLKVEDLKKIENDPIAVFCHFCKEQTGEDANPHLLELFKKAVEKTEEETI